MGYLKQVFDADDEFQEQEAVNYVTTFSVTERRQFWRAPQGLFNDTNDVKGIFESIYDRAIWGGGSGSGSDFHNTILYAAYVQHLMEKYSVESVVDIGCGDWRFTKYLDFDGRQYHGVDIVASVISTNIQNHANNNIHFETGNASEFNIPKCDLLLCKDVLQHLSNDNVSSILKSSVVATHALFTNDYYPVNEDCKNGDTRPLDITAAPFDVKARPRLSFNGKITFLCNNP